MARPRIYKESYPDDLRRLKKGGAFDCEICAEWEISRDTYYRWIKEYPEFKEATDEGKQSFQAYWVKALKEQAITGHAKGFQPIIAILNNQCREEWGEMKTPTTQINIQNNYNQQSSHELEELLKNNLAYLNDNNIIDISCFLKLEDKTDKNE